jgi:hypothetical protein
MFWLDFNLSLSDEFEVEKQVRYIQASTDIDELRTIATELLRFATVQAHVSNQLVNQALGAGGEVVSHRAGPPGRGGCLMQ